MNVILLEKVGKLGSLGDKVTVKSGYGRNFLIPFGKAVPANDAKAFAQALLQLSQNKAQLERMSVNALKLAKDKFAREDLADKFVQYIENSYKAYD